MNDEKLKALIDGKYAGLMDGIYAICNALVVIVDQECCTYGFDEEVDMAELYIKRYEENHGKENNEKA